ncbi:MAG TPA: hypothetical protein VIY08_06560 [Candidatus Nitrosocosmicus sp.]
MNKKNSKYDQILHINTFKEDHLLTKEGKKTKLEYNNIINLELAHMYGS